MGFVIRVASFGLFLWKSLVKIKFQTWERRVEGCQVGVCGVGIGGFVSLDKWVHTTTSSCWGVCFVATATMLCPVAAKLQRALDILSSCLFIFGFFGFITWNGPCWVWASKVVIVQKARIFLGGTEMLVASLDWLSIWVHHPVWLGPEAWKSKPGAETSY